MEAAEKATGNRQQATGEAGARERALEALGAVRYVLDKAYCAVPSRNQSPAIFTGPFDAQHLHTVRAVLAEALRDIPQLEAKFSAGRFDPEGQCVVSFVWREEGTEARRHEGTKGREEGHGQ